MNQIDRSALTAVMEEDQELLEDLATLFAQSLSDSIARMRVAVDDRDDKVLGDIAHQLKSRLRYFGAFKLYQLVSDMELAADSRDFTDCSSRMESLVVGIDELLVELRELTKLDLEVTS